MQRLQAQAQVIYGRVGARDAMRKLARVGQVKRQLFGLRLQGRQCRGEFGAVIH